MDLPELLQVLQKPLESVLPLEWMKLYEFLGNFVPLWLRPEAVEHIEQEVQHQFVRPQLPQDRGSCWIVMAVADAQNYPLLQPAFVIPLQWQRLDQPDRRLPARLQELAHQVRTQLAIAFSDNQYCHWNLYLHPQFAPPGQGPDFSPLDKGLGFDSGWLALAGGLYLARNDGQPDEHVWVSARWDPEKGILRVGHLAEKLALARQYEVRQFFLPDEQMDEVPSEFMDVVRSLRQGSTSLPEVLDGYLSALDVQPACPCLDEASFRRCAQWYMRQPRENLDYYCKCFLPYIAERLKAQLEQNYPQCRPKVLVSLVSPSWNLVPLLARVLQVQRCVLLYTQDTEYLLDKVRPALEKFNGSIEIWTVPFHEATEAEDFARISVWREYPADQVAVDATAGKKRMTLDLYRATLRDSWVLYVDSQISNRRPIPGTEKLICWQRE